MGALSNPMTVLRRHPTSGRYRPEIDGLRFFAIAMVVVGHIAERTLRFSGSQAAGDPGAALVRLLAAPSGGVLLFFAISGFIIASQAMKRRESVLSPSFLSSYFRRRVLRIEPPYFFLLVITFLVVSVGHYTPEGTHRFLAEPKSLPVSLIASILYAHGWLFGTFPRLFPPGWSLEIEVQFYVLAPLIFRLYFGLKHKSLRLALGVGLLCAWILLASVTPFTSHAPYLQNTILRFIAFFWAGILAADWQTTVRDWLERAPRWTAPVLGWAGLILFIAADIVIDARTPVTGALFNSGVLLGTLGMFCGVFGKGSFRNFCASAVISVIGGQCYSIYLTHLQTVQLISTHAMSHVRASAAIKLVADLAVGVPSVVVVGMIFYVLIERPFMVDNWPTKALAALGLPFAKRRLANA